MAPAYDEHAVEELSRYLGEKTVCFLPSKHPDAETLCFRFYKLTIPAMTYYAVEDECVDDLVQCAHCLIGSKKTFSIVLERMLPPDLLKDLPGFLNECSNEFLNSRFEDAVLGAICVLLGIIKDPTTLERNEKVEEQ